MYKYRQYKLTLKQLVIAQSIELSLILINVGVVND